MKKPTPSKRKLPKFPDSRKLRRANARKQTQLEIYREARKRKLARLKEEQEQKELLEKKMKEQEEVNKRYSKPAKKKGSNQRKQEAKQWSRRKRTP